MIRFRLTAGFFLAVFGAMLLIVAYKAYARKSGNTGMDVAKIHLMRVEQAGK